MHVTEIHDKEAWEAFLQTNASHSLFQSWNWGETIIKVKAQRSKVKDFWRLGFYEGETLVGIAQVERVVARRGTFFHVRHGPILSSWTRHHLNSVLELLKKMAVEYKASFIRVSPLIDNTREHHDVFASLGFRDSPMHAMDGEYCWVLDISRSEEDILSGMRKTTRYLIRQAQKLGVEIRQSTDPADIPAFLSLYQETAQRHGFVKHRGVKEEFVQFLKDDQIRLFLGYHQNELLSGAMIIFYHDQAIYHHSASIDQKVPVNYLLQWEVIKEAKRRNKRLYNLWGIAPEGKPRHPWQGLSLFKKGFGGRTIEYLHAQDYPLTKQYWLVYLLERMRRQLKGY